MKEFVDKLAESSGAKRLPWLEDYYKSQSSQWDNIVFPTRKNEHWKYTNVSLLKREGYLDGSAPEVPVSADDCSALTIAGLDSIDLVFVNGYFSKQLSTPQSDLPIGLTIKFFSEADDSEKQKIISCLEKDKSIQSNPFKAVANSFFDDAVYIEIKKSSQLERPVRLLWVSTESESNYHYTARSLINIEENAQATIVEQFSTLGDEVGVFTNAVTDVIVDKNASCRHYRLHLESESVAHIGSLNVYLDRSSRFDSFHLALGAKLKRIDLNVFHEGEGSESQIAGVYLPKNKQHVDYHTCIEHEVPHCTSQEVFRGIIADQAKAVFNGRIHIHRDAQKTLAQLSNKNLLTSNQAEVDTKPELEIYADDVQCAHGATVAQLDKVALHYLKTRGLSEEQAKVMLSFGFINELINGVHDKSIAHHLRPILASMFSRDEQILQYLS